jgi:hypothetical protein
VGLQKTDEVEASVRLSISRCLDARPPVVALCNVHVSFRHVFVSVLVFLETLLWTNGVLCPTIKDSPMYLR